MANFRDWGDGDFRGIMAGVEWCIAKGTADSDSVVGGSYGSDMTNWALTQTERFKAVVSLFGIPLLLSGFGNSEIPSWELDYLGNFPWNEPELYLQRSPLTYAHRITWLKDDAFASATPLGEMASEDALQAQVAEVLYAIQPINLGVAEGVLLDITVTMRAYQKGFGLSLTKMSVCWTQIDASAVVSHALLLHLH